MDSASLIYLFVVIVFCIAGLVNIIISIFRYRNKNVSDYLKEKEQRKSKYSYGK